MATRSLHVVIPMAGHGLRFRKAGFIVPKPMIEVDAYKPMIEVVVNNLGFRGDYHFFVLKEHVRAHSLRYMLATVARPFASSVRIHETEEVTKGQASSVLRVLDEIADSDKPVVVANSDQFLDGWHVGSFMDFISRHDPDGAVLTFHGIDPKWSFARLCDNPRHQNHVVEIAEKKPISNRALVGVFYCRSVELLRTAIVSMMESETKMVNGEWYLAPAYNELIVRGLRVKQYPVARMHGLGTPEDLKEFQALLVAGKVRV